MKVYRVDQIKSLDSYTIETEPIPSLGLMERAARAITEWLSDRFPDTKTKFIIFCGPGNNGGDGLAVARLLDMRHYGVSVVICEIGSSRSADSTENYNRLPKHKQIKLTHLQPADPFPVFDKHEILVDGIFGSGFNRPLEGYWKDLVLYLNSVQTQRIAIDIPSGLFADEHTPGTSIHAHFTLSFQNPKLGFLFAENHERVGQWEILDIGLSKKWIAEHDTEDNCITADMVQSFLRARKKFDHKGTYGHALLVCGGYGKIGAAILAAKGCIRSGTGLVTIHVPRFAYPSIQTGIPEIMIETDEDQYMFSGVKDLDPYQAIGAGCGLGTEIPASEGIIELIGKAPIPLVLDADALNILASNPAQLKKLPKETILTPHPGEFRRLFGVFADQFERHLEQKKISKELGVYIILKGAHTCITSPDGIAYFNTTGNPGMATGGSGDVLTGMITGLIAQGYSPLEACICGVYIHGLAGDMAARKVGEYALIASDIADHIGEAFQHLVKK